MKQRDIQVIINNRGFEQGVIFILTEQAEQISVVSKAVADLGMLMNKMSDIVTNMQVITENVTNTIDHMNKSLSDEDDLNSPTQMIGQ